MNNHCHYYKFNSLSSDKHSHKLVGHTEYVFGFGIMHFHFYYGTTSFDGHFHSYSGLTGFPIKTANGHKHKISGKLETADFHLHYYHNYTNENIAYNSPKILNKVLS